RRALSGSSDRTLRLWDLETAAELGHFEPRGGQVYSVTVQADARRALSCSRDQVRVWDLETGAELRRFHGYYGWLFTIQEKMCRVLLVGSDQTLRLCDVESGTELHRFERFDGTIGSVAILSDGRQALSATRDKTLSLWDLETGAELRRFEVSVNRI